MLSDSPIIVAEGLSRAFKGARAVDQLSLSVEAGAIFGLVGPDGSGKTTTIRLLAAILDPTDGYAQVAGFDTVTDPEPIKQRIGYMAQRFNLYGDLTVWENLNFYADVFEVRGMQRKERIERLLRFARLVEFRDRRAAHLSGGMQKKLALACTLIHTPEVILLDEPTTGVDPVSRRELWDILTDLHLQGITLVVSTPYMDEAERCSKVGMLYQGKLIVCDTPEKIKTMTDGELIALWPSDPRRARPILESLDGIIEVQTYGDQLRVFAEQADAAMHLIRKRLQSQGIGLTDIKRAAPRMEEAFISLVTRQSAGSVKSLDARQAEVVTS